jgi:hypothetical protein
MGSEWLITVVIIPIIVFLFKGYFRHQKNFNDRISVLEQKVQVVELTILDLRDDVEEIKKIKDDLSDVKLDIREIKTLLNNSK